MYYDALVFGQRVCVRVTTIVPKYVGCGRKEVTLYFKADSALLTLHALSESITPVHRFHLPNPTNHSSLTTSLASLPASSSPSNPSTPLNNLRTAFLSLTTSWLRSNSSAASSFTCACNSVAGSSRSRWGVGIAPLMELGEEGRGGRGVSGPLRSTSCASAQAEVVPVLAVVMSSDSTGAGVAGLAT